MLPFSGERCRVRVDIESHVLGSFQRPRASPDKGFKQWLRIIPKTCPDTTQGTDIEKIPQKIRSQPSSSLVMPSQPKTVPSPAHIVACCPDMKAVNDFCKKALAS
jgi:hypothetical protein